MTKIVTFQFCHSAYNVEEGGVGLIGGQLRAVGLTEVINLSPPTTKLAVVHGFSSAVNLTNNHSKKNPMKSGRA